MHLLRLFASFLLFFVSKSTTAPFSADPSSILIQQERRDSNSFLLSTRLQSSDKHVQPSNSSSLISRAVPAVGVGHNWVLLFEQTLWALPVQQAANELVIFYNELQAEAASRADQSTFTQLTQFGKGNLRLDIFSEGAIPWYFIGSFAGWMLEVTRAGFAGFYRARVVNAASGVTVMITLHLMA